MHKLALTGRTPHNEVFLNPPEINRRPASVWARAFGLPLSRKDLLICACIFEPNCLGIVLLISRQRLDVPRDFSKGDQVVQ